MRRNLFTAGLLAFSVFGLSLLSLNSGTSAQSLATSTQPAVAATSTPPALPGTATHLPATATRAAAPPRPIPTLPPVVITVTPSVTPTQSGGYPPLQITPYTVRRGLDVRAFYDPLYVEVGSVSTGRLIVLVNSPFGPVEEIPYSNFLVFTYVQPRDFACIVKVESLFGGVKGIYGINFSPYQNTPECRWRAGRYVLVLVVTKDDAEGTAFVEFEVDSAR